MATASKSAKVVKLPKTIGAALDLLFTTRERRRLLQRQAVDVTHEEAVIEEQIFKLFKKSQLEGARGRFAQASVSRVDVPTLKDWKKFSAYLVKTKQLDLLQHRLSVEACRERWAAKKTIPGVEVFTRVSLSLTKLKGKP